MSGWVERDAAVVWHGFTQMATFADNAPIIVERAEGRELIDTDGNRYLDAISSLVGQHVRPPRSRARRRAAAPARPRRAQHAARQRQSHHDRVRRGAGAACCRCASRTCCSRPTARPPSSRPSRSPSSTGRTRACTDARSYLALGNAYHGDTDRLDLARRRWVRHRRVRPAAIRRAAASPGYDDPAWADQAVAADPHARRHARRGRARATRAGRGRHAGHRTRPVRRVVATALSRNGRAARRRRGRHRVRPHRHPIRQRAVRHRSRTCSASARASPVATCRSRPPPPAPRVYDAFLGPDLGERTFYHGHSYSGNALACAVAHAHLDAVRRARRAGQRRGPAVSQLDGAARGRRRQASRGAARFANAGLMVGVELAPPARGLALGSSGVRRGRANGACCCGRSAMWSCSCPSSPARATRSNASRRSLGRIDRRSRRHG